MSLEECEEEGLDPFDYDNWSNLSDLTDLTNESKKFKKYKTKTSSSDNNGMAIDVKNALPKEDLGNDKMKLESFSKFKNK